jgi:hypothetical protein
MRRNKLWMSAGWRAPSGYYLHFTRFEIIKHMLQSGEIVRISDNDWTPQECRELRIIALQANINNYRYITIDKIFDVINVGAEITMLDGQTVTTACEQCRDICSILGRYNNDHHNTASREIHDMYKQKYEYDSGDILCKCFIHHICYKIITTHSVIDVYMSLMILMNGRNVTGINEPLFIDPSMDHVFKEKIRHEEQMYSADTAIIADDNLSAIYVAAKTDNDALVALIDIIDRYQLCVDTGRRCCIVSKILYFLNNIYNGLYSAHRYYIKPRVLGTPSQSQDDEYAFINKFINRLLIDRPEFI